MRNERDFMDVILLRQLCSRQFKFSRVCTSFVLLSVLLMFVIRAWWWLNKPKHKTSEYFILPLCCVRLFWVKNYSKKRYLHFNYLTLLHHVIRVQKWLIWFYAVLLWFDSLMMLSCGSKHEGMLSVILQYKYLRNNILHFVGLLSWI